MKRFVIFAISLILLQGGPAGSQQDNTDKSLKNTELVTVAVAPEIETLAGLWLGAFRNENTGIDVSALPSGEYENADIRLFTGSSAGIYSRDEEWKMVVARDVIVPVTGTGNPFTETLLAKGISPAKFGSLLSETREMTWGDLLDIQSKTPATVRLAVDNAGLNSLARFAGTDPAQINALQQVTPGEINTLLKNQPGLVLFCRLADITDRSGTCFAEGLRIIPIDVNGNGRSDYFEQFYSDYSSFNRGVYIGKYPRELCNSIFCATASKNMTEASAVFIRWLLAGGQELIAGAGYTALSGGEGMTRREMLAPEAATVYASTEGKADISGWIWVIAIAALAILLAFIVNRVRKPVLAVKAPLPQPHLRAFSPKTFVTPAGILFDRNHTWAFMEKNGTITVGIDDFLQHVTGPITRVTMRSAGEKVRKGERIASLIQKGKQLDILSPVSGTITTCNDKISGNTEVLHSAPYTEGWIYGIEPDNWQGESRLMCMADRYADYLREQFVRIKDFLASFAGAGDLRYASVVLQDGGELKEGFLEDFGPEVWEEFQVRFINRY
jgi:glycine cleavage system H lipoate-binding protein